MPASVYGVVRRGCAHGEGFLQLRIGNSEFRKSGIRKAEGVVGRGGWCCGILGGEVADCAREGGTPRGVRGLRPRHLAVPPRRYAISGTTEVTTELRMSAEGGLDRISNR